MVFLFVGPPLFAFVSSRRWQQLWRTAIFYRCLFLAVVLQFVTLACACLYGKLLFGR